MSERKRIYLCLAHMSEDGMEQKYVKEAFDTNWVVPLGPNVNGFEKDLEEFVFTNSSRSFSKPFTFGPRGTTQFVSKASFTYFCSIPSSLM